MMAACSQEKNTIVNRSYHNLTARYNGFFNGRLALAEAHDNMRSAYQEDYTNLLPIFIYMKADVVQPVYPQLDRSIAKTSLVIDRHSMDISGKEYCNWIDDAWMIMGQAQFLKGEYTQAKQIFDYTKRKYNDPKIKQLSYFWLARIYTEEESFERASDQLRKVKTTEGFPEELLGEYYAFRAYFYLRQNRRSDAIKELEQAIFWTKNRSVKTRLIFILAQLQRLEGDGAESSRLYAEVISRNPDYEMAFYAKINRALAFDVTAGKSEEIKAVLFKMLKDDKNIEYKDQIYYALAELELKEKNEPKAIEYLKLATTKSVKNGNAKGLAFLKLGDIYFSRPDYPQAQAYYDSTVTFLSTEHPDYNIILARANSLTQMMRDINIIDLQDSLQQFVTLPEKEQDKRINKIISDLEAVEKEAERQKQIQELQSQQAAQQQRLPTNQNIQKGEWYFYNPAAVGFGAAEFKKIWGNRKNEDDWRRKDKTSLAPLMVEGQNENENDTLDGANDPKNPNYYKKNLPTTEAKILASNDLIIEAYYDLALVYKNSMLDEPKAVETFETLITRFDSSKYHPNVYYQLYLINQKNGNTAQAEYYKTKLLSEFPQSDYSKTILNPEYSEDSQEKEAAIKQAYSKCYAYFEQGFYKQCLDQCQLALEQYPNTSFTPQFKFLEALCTGYTEGRERMLSELEIVKTTFSGSDVGNEAAQIIEYLTASEESINSTKLEEELSEKEITEALENFNYNIGSTHNFILIVPDSLDPMSLKSNVADFNRKYFSTKGYKTTMIPLSENKSMIVVSDVGFAAKAMDYYNTFTKAAPENKSLLANPVKPFVISLENYAHFYKNQNIEAYQIFFSDNYEKVK